MADLFTHVLAGYVLATVLSWRWEWITPPLVTVAMVGAVLPDLSRIELIVPSKMVEGIIGLSFSWSPLHRAGGTLLVILTGALLVPRRLRRGVLLLLVIGAGSHYALDFLLYKPSSVTGDLLWPFTGQRFAIDGLYLSSDRWPAVVAGVVAGVVWVVNRRIYSR